MTSEDEAASLVRAALRIDLRSVVRQPLTHSSNAVFRVVLADERSVALRISPQANTFNYTAHNLEVLRGLGLPVQTVLATGRTPTGGSFIILNWIPGRDLLYELSNMRPEQMMHVAQSVADYQRRVGTLPQSKRFGWAPIGRDAQSAAWDDIFGPPAISPMPPAASKLDNLRERLRRLRALLQNYFQTVMPICFLDDLTLKNVLVADGTLRGIIDLDYVCYGDPLMSVGATLAYIERHLGPAGRTYGEALVHCWSPTAQAHRALRFYAALWAVGFSATATVGNSGPSEQLMQIAEQMVRVAEEPELAACDQHRTDNSLRKCA